MNLVEELWRLYEKEDYVRERMSKEEADAHHESMLKAGKIITISDGERLAGYVEYTIQAGCVFIIDLFIEPEYRRGRAIWQLYRRLIQVSRGAKVYMGERNKFNMRYPEVQIRSQYGV